jgi:outer membrane receptor for ferrienterochelin and colicins
MRERALTLTVSGREGRRLFRREPEGWKAEIASDVAFALGPGRFKLIGLVRHEHEPRVATFRRLSFDNTGQFDSTFSQTTELGEYILRAKYTLGRTGGQEWQPSAEAAFNSLVAGTELAEAFGAGPLTPVSLDRSKTRVEEVRGKALLIYSRPIGTTLGFQIAAGA